MVALLLRAGANPNEVTNHGTVFQEANMRSDAMARLFIEFGVDTNATSPWLRTPPIVLACEHGAVSVLQVPLVSDGDAPADEIELKVPDL
jgi:hypothetical protein